MTPAQQIELNDIVVLAEKARRKAGEQWQDFGYGAFAEQVEFWEDVISRLEALQASA